MSTYRRFALLLLGPACYVPDTKTTPSGRDSSEPSADDTAGGGETGDSTSGGDDSATTGETATSETGDSGDVDEPDTGWKMDDAVAEVKLDYSYNGLGFPLATADLAGEAARHLLLAQDNNLYAFNRGYVLPGTSAMASEGDDPDLTGLVTLINDLWTTESWYPVYGFAPVGDIDGDGINEIPFPQPTLDHGPYVYSGATLSTERYPDGEAPTSGADLTITGADELGDALGSHVVLGATAAGAPAEGGTLEVTTIYAEDDGDGTTLWLYPLPQAASSLALDEASASIQLNVGAWGDGDIDIDGDGLAELLTSTYFETSDSEKHFGELLFDFPADSATVTEADARSVLETPIPDPTPYISNGVLLPGDMDGDGLDDLIVRQLCPDTSGCPGLVAGVTTLSSLVGEADLSAEAAWTIQGSDSGDHMGDQAALVPDVDADGAQEVFAYENDGGDGGLAYYLYLSTTLLEGGAFDESGATRSLHADLYDDEVGRALTAGDLDGDGNPELIVQYSSYGCGGAYIFSY